MTFLNFRQQPKLVSCITTLDSGYLTILVNPVEFVNLEKMEEKITQMCRNDAFETIKLRTKEKESIKRWHITVYSSKSDMERGRNSHIIKVEQ